MTKILLKSATLVNEGKEFVSDVLIEGKRIIKIASSILVDGIVEEINCEGLHLLPGCIDDQVHFREPGLTHKATIQTESRAAVAGGITSFMEMPNTVPNTLTQELLEAKYQRASEVSPANYSFFMGASNDNYEEVMRTNIENVCGVKIFMGSSTGNMLVDNTSTLEHLFANVPMLIATHCEDEGTIRTNLEIYKEKYGEDIPMSAHPLIRSAEACYISSSKAVDLAKKNNTRLHILHISSGIETALFRNDIPLEQKRITAEACIHHLWFSAADYTEKGAWIKWNPAVKTEVDRAQIWEALLDNRIDVIATDHAPHTIEEKQQKYLQAPSGGPLVQHALLAMLDASANGKIPLVRVVEKMAHAVAICFQVKDRGFIREGYFADLVLVNLNRKTTITKESLLSQCAWSPFEGTTFSASIEKTFVNGQLVFDEGKLTGVQSGERLLFNR
ncbi:dihydroorotase [Fluviicola taffensis]|uniref:Allantoinase n=1 Tax=Fluviicola taffensis (strain DSM 16823 / NCIMB 13979 / RW262) TaxID=755732 RepID=F2IBV6_FLUTR|nr:dihydroorotase [Fluviicola taffensis]AEA42184.1 Allantoinase [Fluviicola taffensis DSM 16823]